jgi:signal transduction histidine kinase/ActR/RegA family two-component response regulator
MTRVAVRNEQVRMLYSQSIPVLLANVVNSGIVAAALWVAGPRTLLLGWAGLVALMTLARLELRRRYWRVQPAPEQATRWGARFVAGSAAAGVLWGAGGAVFLDADGMLSSILMPFVIGGMGAGAAGTLACYPAAFWAYLLPSVMPLAVRMLMIGDRLHLAMSAMVGVYGLALAVVARITHRAITDALRLRFEKEALLGQLGQAQRTLEESNRTLAERVAQRTAELERQGEVLRHAQRMEAVGRLAGGVAHDFNNLLTVVLANVALMGRETPLDEGARSSMDEIRSAAVRGAELVRQLLSFSRRQKLAPRVLDLNRLVANAERLLVRLIGETVRVRLSLCPGPALVVADPSQLEQVIVNLATNARDAMPHGGIVTVATSTVMADGDATLPAGAYVVLSVDDTGVGMDAETRQRAFEPFFTTKEVGQGTGLGLATVYGIVEQSGGRVTVRSQPGEGTGFDVYLPLATGGPAVETLPTALAPAAEMGAGATILLAEDEPDVRAATTQMLRLAGYDVIAAADGPQALALAGTIRGPIDVLVTDLIMTSLGGVELARQLAAERPGLRVLFISGYGWQELPPPDLGVAVDFLPKPFTFETLTGRIARLLAADAPRSGVSLAERGLPAEPGGKITR